MREFRDRRGVKKILFSVFSALILGGLLFFSLKGLASVYDRYLQARTLRKASEERLTSLEKREVELQGALESLGSPRGFEEEVRKRFGVVLPGERVIEIVDAPLPPSETEGESRTILERILDLF